MKKILMMIFLAAIVLTSLICLFRPNVINKMGDYITQNIGQNKNEETDSGDGVLLSNQENGEDGSGSGGTGGGGTESSNGEASSSNSGCVLNKISYSLKNFEKTSTCNLYDGNICIDKTAYCSVEATNLDFEISGTFEIGFSFFEQGQEEILYSATDSQVLEPRNSGIFEVTANFQGQDANKDLTCSFNTEQVPTREICS